VPLDPRRVVSLGPIILEPDHDEARELPELGGTGLQHLPDDVEIDVQVVVNQHVAKAGHARDASDERAGENVTRSEQLDRLALGLWCAQACCRDQVIGDVQHAVDGQLQAVFHPPLEWELLLKIVRRQVCHQAFEFHDVR